MAALALATVVAGAALLLASRLPIHSAAAAECEFRGGFEALRDQIPTLVGDCTENERFDPQTGDALQHTTGGLLVWRKADNWTAFTNGSTTWIVGPYGLQYRSNAERLPWEASVSRTPSQPQPTPPGQSSIPVVQQAVADAAGRVSVDPGAVQVVSVEARQWPDASLGCPHPDRLYAQVITPGYLVVIEAGGQRFEYHTDSSGRAELCT